MKSALFSKSSFWPLALSIMLCSGCDFGSSTKNEPATKAQSSPSSPEPKPAHPEAPILPPKDHETDNTHSADLKRGLLVAYSQFEVEAGQATANPGPARLELLYFQKGKWLTEVIEDAASNVFHKALVLDAEKEPQILTLGGGGAFIKTWSRKNDTWTSKTVWHKKFGGRFNRMRDAEIADLYNNNTNALAVATHDQGVVAILRKSKNRWRATEIDRRKNTFVHEIEIGDLNSDGILEVYATPSDPNKLDAETQHGKVVRYVPKGKQKAKTVADLGQRHAKEIYVGDVDGDGKDELYVAVEAKTEGTGSELKIIEPVEIRRYDAESSADSRNIIATIPDRLCRFLTVGDVDGDGKKEMIAASFRSGIWLLRPGRDPKGQWGIERVDRDSGGFEHAALLVDLDEDGSDELYVADDNHGELRRYIWKSGRPKREVIHRRSIARSMMTWNITPFPVSILK